MCCKVCAIGTQTAGTCKVAACLASAYEEQTVMLAASAEI